MAVSIRRRGTAVLALAMASGLSLAASTPAGAATATAPAFYHGVTSANVLGVALDLPVALPSVPQHLAVNLIGVTGDAVHNTLRTGDATMSKATSTLASGNLTDQLGLSKTITASLNGVRSAASDGLAVSGATTKGLLSLNVGPLRANVASLNNAASAELLDAKVLDLGSLLGATTNGATNTLVQAVQNNVSSVESTVKSQLNNALNQVNQAVAQVPGSSPAAGVVSQVQTAVQTVTDKVNAVINQVLNAPNNASVLTVQTLSAKQNIAPAGNAAKATADTVLANLNLLNGLVTIDGFESHALAIANGKAGGAMAKGWGVRPLVHVGTPVLSAALDTNGLNLSSVSGLGAATDTVNSALAELQSALNTLLGQLGVHLNYVDGTSSADTATGRTARATGAEYDVVVANPLSPSSAIAVVGLGHGTTASVSAAQATRVLHPQNPQLGKLPHTGANLPLIAGGGLAFLLGAAYLRRRVGA